MNQYVKAFLHRGMLFGGFGPIIAAIVFAILGITLPDFTLTGGQVLMAVVSTYILAFVQAGVSVFNQIEHWSVGKSLFFHLTILYITYAGCYLLNTWIPFEPMVLVIFSGIFIVCYFVIWLTVYFSVKAAAKRFNKKIG